MALLQFFLWILNLLEFLVSPFGLLSTITIAIYGITGLCPELLPNSLNCSIVIMLVVLGSHLDEIWAE